MPGKNFLLTPLESRKQLLLVESELNRAQLVNELRELKGEIHHLKNQAQAVGSLISATTEVAATFSAIGSAFTHRDADKNGKPSWISTLLNGVQAGVSIWGALRSNRK